MTVSRRTMILGAGGLALVAAGGYWRVARQPQTALDPWEALATPEPDVRLDAFRHAILAPNPHNRQPWLIRLDGEDGATIFCDLDRRLPQTDPFDRQVTIGFGCFLELARMAAAERGHTLMVEPFPEGEPEPRLDERPIARLRFDPGARAKPDPLFPQVPVRRTNKEAYDLSRAVTREDLRPFNTGDPSHPARLRGTSIPESVAAIRKIVLEALDIEIMTPRAHRESVDLIRIGAKAVDAQPDGIDLTGPMIEAASAIGMMTNVTLADPESSAFQQGRTLMAETYGSAPAFIWVASTTNDRRSQLEAGRLHLRSNLLATSMGLSVHPASQALQEYPEVKGPFERIHQMLLPEGGRLQMLSRIGYGPKAPPSPRYPLAAKLLA